ncbi:MAG: hypothetical protein MJ080_01860 [Clostridia bacterium]|nr:hypothetical protein [Clostridia bacterium]
MTAEVFKISLVALVSVSIVLILKNYKSEYAFLFSLAVSLCLITVITAQIFPTLKALADIYKKSSGNGYGFSVILKAVAISYLAEFSGDTCRDFGQTALAGKVELAGKCAILVLSIPLITSILQTAIGFMDL